MPYRLKRGLGARGSITGVSDPAIVGSPFLVVSSDPVPVKRIAGSPSDRGSVQPIPVVQPAPVSNVTAPVVVSVAPAPVAAPAPVSGSTDNWFTDSMFGGIPNWMLLAGGGGALLLFAGWRR